MVTYYPRVTVTEIEKAVTILEPFEPDEVIEVDKEIREQHNTHNPYDMGLFEKIGSYTHDFGEEKDIKVIVVADWTGNLAESVVWSKKNNDYGWGIGGGEGLASSLKPLIDVVFRDGAGNKIFSIQGTCHKPIIIRGCRYIDVFVIWRIAIPGMDRPRTVDMSGGTDYYIRWGWNARSKVSILVKYI